MLKAVAYAGISKGRGRGRRESF